MKYLSVKEAALNGGVTSTWATVPCKRGRIKRTSMRNCKLERFFGLLLIAAFVFCMLTGCAGDSADKANVTEAEASYVSEEVPLGRGKKSFSSTPLAEPKRSVTFTHMDL